MGTAYCLIRRINAGGQTPARLKCNARTCFIVGILKMGIGIFEITYFASSGGTWWGWILILFSMFWIVRGNKFRAQARTISAGYLSMNDDESSNHHSNNIEDIEQDSMSSRRLSNAPQVVIIDADNNDLIHCEKAS